VSEGIHRHRNASNHPHVQTARARPPAARLIDVSDQ
jgi:hypothetical protein